MVQIDFFSCGVMEFVVEHSLEVASCMFKEESFGFNVFFFAKCLLDEFTIALGCFSSCSACLGKYVIACLTRGISGLENPTNNMVTTMAPKMSLTMEGMTIAWCRKPRDLTPMEFLVQFLGVLGQKHTRGGRRGVQG